MPSLLKEMQEVQSLQSNALLYFWEVVDILHDGEDKTHVIFFDSMSIGGWDQSETEGQMACTNKHVRDEEYRLIPSRQAHWQDRLGSITCVDCRRKVYDAMHYSGVIDGEYFFNE